MRLSHKILIILCMSGTALATPTLAQDVPPAVQVILDNMEQQTQVKPTYGSIETDADGNITITRLELTKPADKDAPSVTMRIDNLVLSGISDEGDGLYRIRNSKISNINGDMSGPDMAVTFEIPEGSAEDWYVKAKAGENASGDELMREQMTIARKFTLGMMNMAMMGQKFTVDGYEQTWDGDPKTGAGSYTMSLSNIAIPEQAIAMIDQGGMLKQLGYTGLNIDLKGDGKMDIQDGQLDMDMNFTINSRDMGSLSFGAVGGGLPTSFFAELKKAQSSGDAAKAEALIPQLANVAFSSVSVRFEDASITKKVLPMVAAMQGMDEAQLVAMAGPMLQMGLMQLQNQAFAEQAGKAVNSFLTDPKSITITAKPEKPFTAAELQTMNPNAPGEYITRLGLSVSAND